MKKKINQNIEGITLLSALVTIGILGAIALVSTQIFVNAIKSSGQSDHRDSAFYIEKYISESLHCCNTLYESGNLSVDGSGVGTDVDDCDIFNYDWNHPTESGSPKFKRSIDLLDYNGNSILGPPDVDDGYTFGDWSVYIKCGNQDPGYFLTQQFLTIELSSKRNNLQTEKSYDTPEEISGVKLCSAVINDPSLCTERP